MKGGEKVQQILFTKNGLGRDEPYVLKLPKIITHVSPFEMQFGLKQPAHYKSTKANSEDMGVESKEIRGITDRVRI